MKICRMVLVLLCCFFLAQFSLFHGESKQSEVSAGTIGKTVDPCKLLTQKEVDGLFGKLTGQGKARLSGRPHSRMRVAGKRCAQVHASSRTRAR